MSRGKKSSLSNSSSSNTSLAPWLLLSTVIILLDQITKIAVERRCGRMEWSVLDWNTPARDLYFKLGAKAMEEWTVFRMTPEAFGRLAREGMPGGPRG